MPPKSCPNCGAHDFYTDHSAGDVVCNVCSVIVESGVLVSEVGFAEGAGGRVHVQGTFVSNFATGIGGSKGRGGEQNFENIKAQGKQRIDLVSRQMGIDSRTKNGAQRFFGLAVDNKFNRGRKTDYIIASCLYLQCRISNDPRMLIDFSERLSVNVYELGATYLRLRTILNLHLVIPEVDPAIYNIRFAHRLDFGPDTNTVATDASRLVRRFQADWMTQGRRPAGVCGACLIVAARMSNYMRTPEEVAQVVKVSAATIRRRLLEFARTGMAAKTVEEWRQLTDVELQAADSGELPPVLKAEKAKMERQRLRVLRRLKFGDGEEDEEQEAEADGENGAEDQAETGRRRKRRRKGGDEGADGDHLDVVEALQAMAKELAGSVEEEAPEGHQEEDRYMPELEQTDYLEELGRARDNPEEAEAERRGAKRAYMRENRAVQNEKTGFDDPESVLDHLGNLGALDGAELKDEEDLQAMDDDDKGDEEKDDDEEGEDESYKPAKKVVKSFSAWQDTEAAYQHLESLISEDKRLLELTSMQIRSRVELWCKGRPPQDVIRELQVIEKALRKRERGSRARPEVEFPDIDDVELEGIFGMSEEEVNVRARLWLSHNGKWLVDEKERQEKRAAYNKAHGIDPNKPKPKRKRPNPAKQGPFPSAREAITHMATQKKFSARVNYDVLRTLGLGGEDYADAGLNQMDDDDEKEEDDKYETLELVKAAPRRRSHQ